MLTQSIGAVLFVCAALLLAGVMYAVACLFGRCK